MTKLELADLVARYAHRPDLAQDILDIFIPLGEVRIGRELKSSENEALILLQPASNNFDVPADFATIRALQYAANGGPFTLTSLDLHSINQWSQTGGTPQRYVIANRQIQVRPFVAGDFTLFYYQRPALPTDQSENAVLEAWPNVYLYGALIELNIFAQDTEQLTVNVQAFDLEVKQINKSADRGRGDKPAMRRA